MRGSVLSRSGIMLSLCLLMLAGLTVSASAEIPNLVNYQGRLTDDQGVPVVDGTYSIIFFIYDSPSDGSILWVSDRVAIEVEDGLFDHQLGPLPDDIFSEGDNRYLAMRVEGENIEPRTQLIAVPYAYHSLRADSVVTVDGALGGEVSGRLTASDSVTGDLTGSIAVRGVATSSGEDSFAAGVEGQASAEGQYSFGYGVRGTASGSAENKYGVYGSASGIGGEKRALFGSAVHDSQDEDKYGVYGRALHAGRVNYGVYGSASGADTNYAGYFSGNVHITGNLSKGSGSFMIDHPLDPAGKYLCHSFVESPDMMNMYNGNIVTDHAGTATVELPEYFSALNADFRYQLTVVGQFAQAIVSNKIEGNHFIIKTDKPDVEVSWQVTGIRQDAYAEENRIQVEEDKPEKDKGLFLHPEVFGFGPEKSINSKPGDMAIQNMSIIDQTQF